MTARAFAPGHVSGLFAIHDEAVDPLARGSRGAGWSLELGAHAQVHGAPEHTTIELAGERVQAPVTKHALDLLAPGTPLHVDLHLDLSVGQGFGMSAAGTLAACLAAASLLDLEPEAALRATHRAEVELGGGLGDAVGSWFGAGEVRLKPGCPPHGWAMRIEPPEDAHFLFVQLGDPIQTRSIIREDAWRARTRQLADPAVDRILAAGRQDAWRAVLEESSAFSRALGLMPPTMLELGQALEQRLPGVGWGQCMLGTTMWVTGPETLLGTAQDCLRDEGRPAGASCGVDPNGARLVRR